MKIPPPTPQKSKQPFILHMYFRFKNETKHVLKLKVGFKGIVHPKPETPNVVPNSVGQWK